MVNIQQIQFTHFYLTLRFPVKQYCPQMRSSHGVHK
jgi:hypothetical protein